MPQIELGLIIIRTRLTIGNLTPLRDFLISSRIGISDSFISGVRQEYQVKFKPNF